MYNKAKTPIWYGELRTARGNTIVIHDKEFPEASAGRIYLYNTQRDSIIEYAEDIVKNNLHNLDKASIKAAEETYGTVWNTARSEFMGRHEGWVEANTSRNKASVKKDKDMLPKQTFKDKSTNAEIDLYVGSESQDKEFADGWSGGLEE
jgi:hypothetical protein